MINILSQPAFISPSGNPMLFRIEDTDPNALFFRAVIRETGSGDILGIHKVFKTPTSDGNFVDVARRLADYTYTELDNSSNIYDSINGAVQYYVEFTSTDSDGNTVNTLTTGNYWAINGGGDVLNGSRYDVTDWYMSEAQVGVKYADFLTSKPIISDIFIFQKEMVYFLADANSGVDKAIITVYDKTGNIITSIEEPTPVAGSGKIIHRLYLQPNVLATVYDFDVSLAHKIEYGLYSSTDTQISYLRTYIIDSEYDCRFDKVNVLWENYEGGIDTYTFINPRETKNASRQTMVTNGYTEAVDNVYKSLSRVVSTSVESTYRLTTLPLSDDMYRTLSNMIGTRNAYVELGDGSVWGIILGNTSVEVKRRKYENSLLRFDLNFKSLPNLDMINRGSVLITEDRLPNPMVFTNVTGAEFNQQYTSNSVQITGINVTVPISVTGTGGAEYRVNNGVWTNQPSIANNGDIVTLRTTTAQASLQSYTVNLLVGEGTASWSVTTKAILNTPDTVTFTSQTNTALNTTIYSNEVTISGINVPISISVSNGLYSKNGATFSTGNTTAVNGDKFVLRHTSANASLTGTTTVFNYGGKTANFSTTTREYDITPNDFSFTDSIEQPVNTVIYSNTITVGGITDPVSISVTEADYQINGGAFVNTTGTVVNGDTVRLRTTTNANTGQSKTAVLTISNKTGSWFTSTATPDYTPNPFTFSNKTGAETGTYIGSNTVTVTGINTLTPVSINNTSYASFRINGGSWVTSGSISNGQTLQLRILTSTSYMTSRSASVSVGTYNTTFSVTTKAEPVVYADMCWTKASSFRYNLKVTMSASITQSLTISGNLTYPGDNGGGFPTIESQPYSITVSANSSTRTISVNTDKPIASTGSANIQVTSSTPAEGSSVNLTGGGSSKLDIRNTGEC